MHLPRALLRNKCDHTHTQNTLNETNQGLNNWEFSHVDKQGLWGTLFGSNDDSSEPEFPGHQ